MKKAISVMALMVLFMSHVHAQGFRRHMYQSHRRPSISPAAIVGLSSLGAGCGISLVGFMFYATNGGRSYSEGTYKASIGMVGAGLSLIAIGGGLAIGGGIHDHNKRHKWSLIFPKNNEIGLAWHFR